MTVEIDRFDPPRPGDRITVTNARGSRIVLIPVGARLVEVHVPDRDGGLADVVLGFDTVTEFLDSKIYAGSTAGRFANRIAGGSFELAGRAFQLETNEGRNHLHGGVDGLDRQQWDYSVDEAAGSVEFRHTSPDGHGGYPGALDVVVSYRLADDDVLTIEMRATTSASTILNLVNHAYWNLAGHDSGTVLDHVVQMDAQTYTPVDDELLATGEIRDVADTAFDFTSPRPIGERIADAGERGYDHNWVLDGDRGELHPAAVILDPASGRRLTLSTTEPGVQFYTAGYIDALPGKGGAVYDAYAGFTLETQTFPGAPNIASFPSAVLEPGEEYRHVMVLRFDTV